MSQQAVNTQLKLNCGEPDAEIHNFNAMNNKQTSEWLYPSSL